MFGRGGKLNKAIFGNWIKARIERAGPFMRIVVAEREVLLFRDEAPPAGNMAAIGIAGEIANPVFFDNIVITDLASF